MAQQSARAGIQSAIDQPALAEYRGRVRDEDRLMFSVGPFQLLILGVLCILGVVVPAVVLVTVLTMMKKNRNSD